MANNTLQNSSFFVSQILSIINSFNILHDMLCMCSSTLKAHLFLHNLVWDLEPNPRVLVVFLLSRYSSSTLFIPRPVNIHFQVLLKMQVSYISYIKFCYITIWTTFFPFLILKGVVIVVGFCLGSSQIFTPTLFCFDCFASSSE